MTIKTRFKITVLLTSVLLLLGIICVVLGMWQSHQAIHKAVSMGNLVDTLHELRDIGRDYRLEPTERAKEQWLACYKKIKSETTASPDISIEVQEAVDNLKTVFDGILASKIGGDASGMGQLYRSQQYTNLDLETRRIHDWATIIRDNARGSFFSGSKSYNTGIVAILLLITIISTAVITRVGRRVLSSLQILEQGANSLAEENVGQQLAINGDDEISRVTGAFNSMSRKLFASHEELRLQAVLLEDEIAERQRTQEALQANNILLEEEIEERQAVQTSLEEQAVALEEQTVILEAEIAERTRIKEEHDRLEEQLRQSQKMEAVGQLAGGVAHDFNNILTVISGYSSLLQMDDSLNDEQKKRVDEIASSAERAAQLTRGLLAFSRKQPLIMKHENLNDIVQHVHKFLARIIGEDITFQSACCGAELPIVADRGQIEQVLINLATNARDAMSGGGGLTVKSDRAVLDSSFTDFHNYNVSPGHYALLTVSDTGMGISKEHIDHIFEPFFTTKEVGKGTGLGMAIIYGIIKQHDGFINVYSELGHGTTFRIYLPIDEKTDGFQTIKPEPAPPEGGNETILVAEDEPSVRVLVAKVLQGYGYNVILAEDGVEAVEKFKAHQDIIRLVLMDMIMPKKNGMEAYEEISRIKPGVKLLFSSGYPADFIENRGVSEKAVELIMKPVQPMELLRKVREILDK